jgi:hypothetical protein
MLEPAPSVVVQLTFRWASITAQCKAGKKTVLLSTTVSRFSSNGTRGVVTTLFVVYVAVTAVPRGPKLDPKIVTT